MRKSYDFLIVGAGFAGSVCAERLAPHYTVLLCDRRPHVGGNAYDYYNDDGVLVHKYGPHIFHTNASSIFLYLSQFTDWRAYEHRVLASVRGKLVPVPINLTTVNTLFDLTLTSAQLEAWFTAKSEPCAAVRTAEDYVVSQVGRELYELLYRGYTRKQWALDPSELDASVAGRLPFRSDLDDRYFTDAYQYMPAHGYTRMFENMLDHPNIDLVLDASYRDVQREVSFGRLIFTGPIDAFFDYCFGPLPYRSIRFRNETHAMERFQSTGTINYPDEAVPFTRVTEFKHLTGQRHAKTAVAYEYPCANDDPYYPILNSANRMLYHKYSLLAEARPEVFFLGRLGSYRYYNMDQVVGQALAFVKREFPACSRPPGRAAGGLGCAVISS